MASLPVALLEAVVREVCCLDVQALKPGNVSVYAPGHRMTAADFIRSVDAIASTIMATGITVGERVRRTIEATIATVGCNTNLGIVLLLAPLVQAMMQASPGQSLRRRLDSVLTALTVGDAEDVYIAIRLAHPAGLGQASEQDLTGSPTVTLRAAMALAAQRDRVARQYACGYADIFDVGIPALRAADARHWKSQWAAVACYLRFLAEFPDSHIHRKFGAARAKAVMEVAAAVETRLKACDNPWTAVPMLLEMDGKLKAEGVNPGTSADLTIASLAAWRFETLLEN